MNTILKEYSRFDARIPKEQKLLFEKAASLGGYRNLTDFILIAAQEKAREIIQENELTIASEQDARLFYQAISESKRPSEALKQALNEYNEFLSQEE